MVEPIHLLLFVLSHSLLALVALAVAFPFVAHGRARWSVLAASLAAGIVSTLPFVGLPREGSHWLVLDSAFEELAKGAFLLVVLIGARSKDSFEGLLAGVMVGIGFMALENHWSFMSAETLSDLGFQIIARSSAPLHPLLTGLLGLSAGRALLARTWRTTATAVLTLGAVAAAHAFANTHATELYVALTIDLALGLLLWASLRRVDRGSAPSPTARAWGAIATGALLFGAGVAAFHAAIPFERLLSEVPAHYAAEDAARFRACQLAQRSRELASPNLVLSHPCVLRWEPPGRIHTFEVTGAAFVRVRGENPYSAHTYLGSAAVHAGCLAHGESGRVQALTVEDAPPSARGPGDEWPKTVRGVETLPWQGGEGFRVICVGDQRD